MRDKKRGGGGGERPTAVVVHSGLYRQDVCFTLPGTMGEHGNRRSQPGDTCPGFRMKQRHVQGRSTAGMSNMTLQGQTRIEFLCLICPTWIVHRALGRSDQMCRQSKLQRGLEDIYIFFPCSITKAFFFSLQTDQNLQIVFLVYLKSLKCFYCFSSIF